MKKAFVYILFSSSLGKFYTGFTTLEPEERLERHLKHYYLKSKYTSVTDDWIIFWSLECENAIQAQKIEKHIKSMKSKRYIKNLEKYNEIGLSLLKKF